MSAIIAPPNQPNFELQTELTRLVEKFTLCAVIESMGVVCELRAVTLNENDGTAYRMRSIGIALIELAAKCFAL
jgi:hypothetical protein